MYVITDKDNELITFSQDKAFIIRMILKYNGKVNIKKIR